MAQEASVLIKSQCVEFLIGEFEIPSEFHRGDGDARLRDGIQGIIFWTSFF